MPALTDKLLARLRVEQLMADYMHAIDSGNLEEWPEFFTGDARYQIVTRENHERGLPLSVMSCQGRGMFRDRISAMRTANIFEPHVYCHIASALRILEAGPAIIKTAGAFNVTRTMVDGTMSLFACGRAFDTFAVTGDELKIAERVVVLDSRRIDTLLVIPL